MGCTFQKKNKNFFSSEKSLRIAELLLSKFDPLQRVEFINQTGEPLRTALHMAAAVGNASMVRLLVQNGINREHADKEVSLYFLIYNFILKNWYSHRFLN